MRQATGILRLTAPAQGLHDVAPEIRAWVAGQNVTEGLLTLFIQHTSASLLIQENAAPAARRDLERFLERIAPEGAAYEHDEEGPDDMPAHIRAAVTQTQLSIPVLGGDLALGPWQGIYLCEHRHRPSERRIVLHLLGS